MTAPSVRIAVTGMVIAAIIVAILGMAHVERRQQVIRLGYQLSKAIEELSQQQEENRRLRLEKATLTNPERIGRLAESLGMTQPGPDQIRIISRRAGLAHSRTDRPAPAVQP
ncbi:MAG: cell division protein FtsL [Myxococcota bacterium]